MMKKKYLATIDFALIVGTILVLASFVSYARPFVIAPIDNLETINGAVLFEFENGKIILIDDNLEFSSPKKIFVEDNLVINLKPGKYYWKIEGILESDVREFTILSEVNLKLKQVDDKYQIVNAGNVELDVEVYDNQTFVGNVILDIDEGKDVLGTKFVGKENA